EKPANSAPIRVDMTPGTKFRYAGGGYVILQQLMMDVSGKSFPELMQKTLLQKLGMTHSTFQQPLSRDLAFRAAAGHLPNGQEIKGKWFVLPELAPAGLWTTPTDLARFVIEVLKLFAVWRANMVGPIFIRARESSSNWIHESTTPMLVNMKLPRGSFW